MITAQTISDFNLRIAIRDAIGDNTIDTWSYSVLSPGHSRLDWTGGQANNWPRLDEDVYFEVFKDSNDETGRTFTFLLHTIEGHRLDKYSYACMHRELLYMLMAHFNEHIRSYTTIGPKLKKHYADVKDLE